jgi:hypothetical protein
MLAAVLAALLIAAPAASASPAEPRLHLPPPGAIVPPNAQCPLSVGLNVIPVGCVPWSIILGFDLQQPGFPDGH